MKVKIDSTLAALKDFQLRTVDHVFSQLYQKNRNKVLVADEVGLGKTIVAKGIIAKAFEKFVLSGKRDSLTVVYVCSNQTLARQNINKLNFTGDPAAVDYSNEEDRLTSLAYVSSSEERGVQLRIKAFTPATSFDNNTSSGRSDERILLYRLLYTYADMQEYLNSLKWILRGNRRTGLENWEDRIIEAEQCEKGRSDSLKKIRPRVYSDFRRALEEPARMEALPKCYVAAGLSYEVKYWTLIKNLCQLGIRRNNCENFNFVGELIGELRMILSKVCIEFLKADIFILDEFQRYKKLIENSSLEDEDLEPEIEIAREIFSMSDAKVLMLSATPFKPYTNDFDELNGEVHYGEFKTVLKFLMRGKTAEFWDNYEQDRGDLFSLMRHPDRLRDAMAEALGLKSKLEELYRNAIVRTEKMLVSRNRDALIRHVSKEPISLQVEDIYDFIALDQLTSYLNNTYDTSLPAPLEYVKSTPFSLSFLDNYQHKEKLRSLAGDDSVLRRLLRKTRHGWLNLENINEYKPLASERGKTPPNGKLRLLLNETVLNGGWKYLWIPPCVPYYPLHGAFAESWGFSKTIIFSSWKMVPKMVASLVSYEAERLTVGNPKTISKKEAVEEKREYFSKKRTPRPQFTFKVDKEEREPAQMNNFMLTYPCHFLARLYDPMTNIKENKSIEDIRKDLQKTIIKEFKRRRLNDYARGKGDWQKWYWVAPFLFDLKDEVIGQWFAKGIPPSEMSIDSETVVTDRNENTGKAKHFDFAANIFLTQALSRIPALDDEQLKSLASHLTDLALGSPAVCFLRSLLRTSQVSEECLDASFNVASAFLTMFNKPESIAVIRLSTDASDYWQKVLQYCVAGNMQSMLDEYVYLLTTGENLQSKAEISNFICDILSIRTASVEVDDLNLFMDNLTREERKHKTMRAHYAVDFGTQRILSAAGANRQINIRQAFNSPFRPFVLASTSIGQEGLDFHLYCKKIFHWNLPSNPIDFEQREGRIHRFQGLVIRQNLASKYKSTVASSALCGMLWHAIFEAASIEKKTAPIPCDLVPFWHTESDNDIKIERFVPLYPFSKDVERFNNMIRVLAFYRLTFGQPRQSELVEALHGEDLNDDDMNNLDKLIINLSPICF